MKKMMFMCGMAALMIGMISCKSSKDLVDTNSGADIHNPANSLDWTGTYAGVIPCADCAGIQLSIELSDDNTYTMKQTYLGEDDSNSFDASGKFSWNKKGNVITLGEGERVRLFKVVENQLILLDKGGNVITGELADKYILAKVNTDMVEKYWKLTELFGEPVITPEGAKEVHMILKIEGNRVHGNSGCNLFNGTYTLKPGNKISFSQMASTMMMCLQMDTENKMNQVFKQVDNYVQHADVLVFNNAENTPIARFEAVYLR